MSQIVLHADKTAQRVGAGASSVINGLVPLAEIPIVDPVTHAQRAIDDRIAGLTANDSTKLYYSTFNHSGAGTYVRSNTCWAKEIDLACVSVWNSATSDGKYPVTLISPRHVAMAVHVTEWDSLPFQVRFAAPDGTVVTRSVTSKTQVGSTDLEIGLLDSDVPATITPAWVLHAEFATFPNASNVPVLILEQERKAIIKDAGSPSAASFFSYSASTDAQRATFNETIATGDSSSPVMLWIDRRPVLLSVVTGSGTGSNVTDNRAAVQAAMDALGGGHTLQTCPVRRQFEAATWSLNAPSSPVLTLINVGGGLAFKAVSNTGLGAQLEGVSGAVINGTTGTGLAVASTVSGKGLTVTANQNTVIEGSSIDGSRTRELMRLKNVDNAGITVANNGSLNWELAAAKSTTRINLAVGAVTDVASNADKLALTGLNARDVVRITGEAQRLEMYIGGTISSDASWIVLFNTVQVYLKLQTDGRANGLACTGGVNTLIGWVAEDARITLTDGAGLSAYSVTSPFIVKKHLTSDMATGEQAYRDTGSGRDNPSCSILSDTYGHLGATIHSLLLPPCMPRASIHIEEAGWPL